MKRYPNTTVLLSYMLVILCACFSLMLVSFKNKADRFKVPVIINKGRQTSVCLAPQYMLNAWYHIERMENFSDTLDLHEKGKKANHYQFYEDPAKDNVGQMSNKELRILVDTVNEITMTKRPIWASYLFHHNLGGRQVVLQDDTLVQEVKSFPIYIINNSSTKTAGVELQDGSAMMVVEAISTKNTWEPIEYWSNSWCGNSYETTTIPPHHYLFTRGIKCSGEYATKCRLKLTSEKEVYYSNEFYMSISLTQFGKM